VPRPREFLAPKLLTRRAGGDAPARFFCSPGYMM
jgi:hypothetical protein